MFLLPFILSTITSQSVGHLLAITCGHNSIMAHILYFSLTQLYGGAFTKEDDLFVLIEYLTMLNPAKETVLRVITYLFGLDMCPSGQTSAIMSFMGWKNDLYDQSLYLLIFQSIFFTTLAYICLKIRTL